MLSVRRFVHSSQLFRCIRCALLIVAPALSGEEAPQKAARKAGVDLAAAGSITDNSADQPGQVGNTLILHSVQATALLIILVFISWC